MRGVSGRIINGALAAAVVAALVTQPAFAAPKAPERGGGFGSLIRMIIRALDTIEIRFPPG